MHPSKLVADAIADRRPTLNEADSKALLAHYGVPVVDERRAADPAEAARAAAEIGFPVVVKALGARLTHKTERGLVRLGLGDRGQVERASREVAEAAGDDLEGLLVQPMLAGRRELVAGLLRDQQFGPVVMFGLGGVFAEALRDVVFGIAPLDPADADDLLDGLRAAPLLGEFRGEAAADRTALRRTLDGLARLGAELDEVAEVDINPLLVGPDGRVHAVDALVALRPPAPGPPPRRPVAPSEVGELFHPRSVAFIGASAVFHKWGNLMFTSVLAGGFAGRVHLVNPKGGEIAGLPVHRSVGEIPEPVDLAVVTIPAGHVAALLPELEAKSIDRVLLISSGFSEVGPAGRELEQRLVDDATARGILVLGPNTMGICNPHHAFYCTGAISRPRPGPTAFVSQSGNMGVQLLTFAEQQGIGIRAFAGTGNEAMITIEDALDCFAVDDLSRTVLLYIEGITDGRRFFSSARAVSRLKPVIALKGGRTDAGRSAAASHTGALASDDRVFQAACRQAGIVLADRPTDMLDLAAAFSSLPLPAGTRVAIMTLGGGWGVVTADLCSQYGLEVPPLDAAVVEAIDPLLPDYWSHANPVDLVGDTQPDVPIKVLRILLEWPGCDAIVHLGVAGRKHLVFQLRDATLEAHPDADAALMARITELAEELERDYIRQVVELMDRHSKPVIGVSLAKQAGDKTVVEVPGCTSKGILFAAPEQAVKSLSRMAAYRRWRNRHGVPA